MINERYFIDWLLTQPLDRQFSPRDSKSCPIATCLKDKGHTGVSVGRQTMEYDGVSRPTPNWAVEFINKFDKAFDRKDVSAMNAAATLSV
jgi:hypothetical protein